MAIFSGDISSSEDLLQQRSPPAMSAPATIFLLQRRSLPASSWSSCVLSAKSLVSPFCSGSAAQFATFHILRFKMEYVRMAQGSGKALVSLINQVLDLAKIEAGKLELEPSLFVKKWTGTIMDKSLSGSSSSVSSNELELMQMNRCMMHCLNGSSRMHPCEELFEFHSSGDFGLNPLKHWQTRFDSATLQ
ncbi:Histidine kinase [Arachis hypogaea]|nr:Histidine kinase [Arachis hypogaea]